MSTRDHRTLLQRCKDLSVVRARLLRVLRMALKDVRAERDDLARQLAVATEALRDIAEFTGCSIEGGGCGAAFNAREALRAMDNEKEGQP